VIATRTDWVLSVAEYSIFIRPDLLQQFWQVVSDGGFITEAVAVIDTSRRTGRRVLVEAGGVRPRRGRGLMGRCLTFAEREEIALARAAGESMRSIAGRLGRSASTISRELRRNLDRQGRYRSTAAHALAYDRAGRPKPAKLVTNLALRAKVEKDLEKKYSPEQITGRLRVEFPDDPEMRVSPETIYQSIYVQSRGALRRDLAACLRTGRALRRPSRKVGQRKNRIPNMINVSERPAEAEDRAVPGNWEGDLVRHEALCDRVEVEDLHRCAVAAASRSWGQPEPGDDGEGGKQPRQRRDEPVLPDGSGPASMRRRCTRGTSVNASQVSRQL